MNSIFQAAWEFEEFMRARRWKYCFIGGLAVQRWGKPRFTADADLTLITGFGGEKPFVERILETFSGRLATAGEFALQSRVLLVAASNDIPVDISLGALPFEEATVARATPWDIGEDRSLTTCSAEDLVVHKCFANRPQDWLDIESILRKQESLDQNLIVRELAPLVELKNSPQILDRLNQLFNASP